MTEFDTASTTEVRLMVFTRAPHKGFPLRRRIAQALLPLFEGEQIDGWSAVHGGSFPLQQIIDPDFRLPTGHRLFGWLDDNALCPVVWWPHDNTIPPVMAKTLEGWFYGTSGSATSDPDIIGSIVTVSVPAPSGTACGLCRCGHDASVHVGRCGTVGASDLGCDCLIWRAPLVTA